MGPTKSMEDWLALLEMREPAGTRGSTTGKVEATAPMVVTAEETPPQSAEVVTVTYQRIFYDWAIADGTYTSQQLRKAKVVVKPWGKEQIVR
jgi:hypothetical protein